jgi:hypothetical protein
LDRASQVLLNDGQRHLNRRTIENDHERPARHEKQRRLIPHAAGYRSFMSQALPKT